MCTWKLFSRIAPDVTKNHLLIPWPQINRANLSTFNKSKKAYPTEFTKSQDVRLGFQMTYPTIFHRSLGLSPTVPSKGVRSFEAAVVVSSFS